VPVKVKFDRLIAYSTLQLPLAMAALPVVLNVSHFYGEVLKLSLQIMGPIFIFARVVDAIQDPVIGLISDRFTRRGKRGRLAFVALMIPVLAAGFYMLSRSAITPTARNSPTTTTNGPRSRSAARCSACSA
jgi:GPH family glycoside/pentoside/hexuronide:cation symporter